MFALLPALCAAQEAVPTSELNVTGTLEIGPDGVVRSYELKSKQTPAITTLVKTAVSHWRFVPILDQLKPVIARTRMDVFLQARPVGDKYSIEVREVTFGQPRRLAEGRLPEYPYAATQAHLNAMVLLGLQLDDRGSVAKESVLQTSLGGATTNERLADQWRRLFEQNALDAVRHWHYDLTEIVNGKPVGTQVLQPIAFNAHGSNQQWKALVPGPIHQISWLSERVANWANTSHARDDETVALDSRFKLKSDVIGKTL